MDLSVIVLNYNGRQLLERCLAAVERQSLDREWEVIVVDNASTDGSQEYLRARPAVRLVESPRNLGFAGGNNLGLREARGRYLVLLNNDAYPRPGFLQALVDAADADPRAGAVTALLVFADRPAVIQNAGVLLLDDGAGADRASGQPQRGQFTALEEVFGFCGAAALLRREALQDAGTFDDSFFMYYEDLDLSWRMRLRGWRVLFQPAAVADHGHASTSGEWSRSFTFHVDRNRLLTLLKNARWRLVARSLGRLGRRASVGPRRDPARGAHRRPAPVHLRVLASVVWHLPRVLLARRRIRGRRTVADAQIEQSLYPREQWESSG